MGRRSDLRNLRFLTRLLMRREETHILTARLRRPCLRKQASCLPRSQRSISWKYWRRRAAVAGRSRRAPDSRKKLWWVNMRTARSRIRRALFFLCGPKTNLGSRALGLFTGQRAFTLRRGDHGVGKADGGVGEGGDGGADQGGDDEEPKLLESPALYEERGSNAAGGIHGRVGNGNANEMDQGQDQTDGDAREADGSFDIGGA